MPKPKQWDKAKMNTWLRDYPISDPNDVNFIQNTVQNRKEAAERIVVARVLENDMADKADNAGYGPIPMLCLIMALVHSDEIRRAYLKRNAISTKWIALDNQKSLEMRATTIWELLSNLLNKFAPVTEYIDDLHSDYARPISIPHSRVSTLFPTTPDKVQEKITTVAVSLQRIIQNCEPSGQGDSGIDIENDGDKLCNGREFGVLTNRSHGALSTRAAFLENNQPYLLYFWEMLDKYQLLSTAFSELNQSMSAKNGGKGVPSVFNELGLSDSDGDEFGLEDCLDNMSSLGSSSKKLSSSSKKKSKTKTKKSVKFNNTSDFAQGLHQLAESNITLRMDLGATIRTNILSLKAEYHGLDMALTDDPPPREKAKLKGKNGNCSSSNCQNESQVNEYSLYSATKGTIFASLLQQMDLKVVGEQMYWCRCWFVVNRVR